MIEQIVRNPRDGQLVNRLLSEFHRGAPLEYLCPLLLSPDPELANTGAWIASELGVNGKPLLDTVAPLLGHPDRRVRFWILDCILLWASPANQGELCKTARLIDDPDKAVRWKAMNFLARASREQLEAALVSLAKEEPESPNVRGLRWMLSDAGRDTEAVALMLHNTDPPMRKFAAVAAARIVAENGQEMIISPPLGDSEVTQFLEDWLKIQRA